MDQEKIGKLIAKLRKEKEMTQDELGKALGVNGKTISKWERGINMPDISLLNNMSEILGVDVGNLLNGIKNTDKREQDKIRKKRQKVLIFFSAIAFVIYSIFLILFTMKIVIRNFNMISFSSTDTNYSISGKVISTYDKKIITLDNITFQGENSGTLNEPLAKSIQVFIKNNNQNLISISYEDEYDEYGNIKYHHLGDILENMSLKEYELSKKELEKLDNLTLNIIYISEEEEIINSEVALHMQYK